MEFPSTVGWLALAATIATIPDLADFVILVEAGIFDISSFLRGIGGFFALLVGLFGPLGLNLFVRVVYRSVLGTGYVVFIIVQFATAAKGIPLIPFSGIVAN
jgi:hypothetical protein